MTLRLLLCSVFLGTVFSIHSQELLLKETKVPWQGLTFHFPEDVVLKETNLTYEKSLHVYPARREPFFVVIRKLPLKDIQFSKEGWESEIFWRGKNVEKRMVEMNGIKYTVYSADQVRNQNLLRGTLWLWSEQDANFWVWILFRKEMPKLVDFFENGRFLFSTTGN